MKIFLLKMNCRKACDSDQVEFNRQAHGHSSKMHLRSQYHKFWKSQFQMYDLLNLELI